MFSSNTSYSIQGSWRGQYTYADRTADDCDFEAIFVEVDGIFAGSILDDCRLGEAMVKGRFECPDIVFTKRYRMKGTQPVRYIGTLSEDGKTLSGTWNIPGSCNGKWFATRYDDQLNRELKDLEQANRADKVPELEPAVSSSYSL